VTMVKHRGSQEGDLGGSRTVGAGGDVPVET
jgi:hypothetical protein